MLLVVAYDFKRDCESARTITKHYDNINRVFIAGFLCDVALWIQRPTPDVRGYAYQPKHLTDVNIIPFITHHAGSDVSTSETGCGVSYITHYYP